MFRLKVNTIIGFSDEGLFKGDVCVLLFNLSLLSVCLRVVFVYPKTHLYSYFTYSPSCVGKLN